jgi:integrase
MRVLKAIYNDAARSHDLPPNPVSRAVRFNKHHQRNWAVGPEGLPALWQKLDAMKNQTHAAVWLVMLLTGLRVTDACSMRWENLDADGVLLVPSPKGGPDRAFKTPMPRLVLQALARVKEETAKLESPFVFASTGKRYPYLQCINRCDAFPYAPHAMRHTYRTAALEAGVDMQTITLLMNHRPHGVTWTYVTRAQLIGPMREAQEKISAAISRHRGTPLPIG